MLGNYKIRVNNEAESKEAQELFFELGYRIGACTMEGFPYSIVAQKDYSSRCGDLNSFKRHKELTLPKLKDMVVLHRNDVDDWNCVDPEFKEQKLYLCSDKALYVFDDLTNTWKLSSKNGVDLVLNRLIMRGDKSLNNLISGNPEQGLVTGSDAFNAKMAGESVLWKMEGGDWQEWTDCTCWSKVALTDAKYSFKIKPKTVKIEIEIPAPFEPKDGERFYTLETDRDSGYNSYNYINNAFCKTLISNSGAWRTEEEIKKVVEALRSVIKGVDNV